MNKIYLDGSINPELLEQIAARLRNPESPQDYIFITTLTGYDDQVGRMYRDAITNGSSWNFISMDEYGGMDAKSVHPWPKPQAVVDAEAKRARRAAKLRSLARKGAIDSVMPPGLWRTSDGTLKFECRGCGEPTEWPAEIAEFDINNHANMCGGSPRCCP